MNIVLLIQAGKNGPVKIVTATDKGQRRVVEALQRGNHELLTVRAVLDGDERIERRLHVAWEDRGLGRDWYERAVLDEVPPEIAHDPLFDEHEEARRVRALALEAQLGR